MQKIFSIFTLMLFFGCATGNRIREIDTEITRCKTTRAQLISAWGDPDKEGSQSGFKTMMYSGLTMGHSPLTTGLFGANNGERAIIFLNSKDIVVDYARNPIGTIIEVKDNCGK